MDENIHSLFLSGDWGGEKRRGVIQMFTWGSYVFSREYWSVIELILYEELNTQLKGHHHLLRGDTKTWSHKIVFIEQGNYI